MPIINNTTKIRIGNTIKLAIAINIVFLYFSKKLGLLVLSSIIGGVCGGSFGSIGIVIVLSVFGFMGWVGFSVSLILWVLSSSFSVSIISTYALFSGIVFFLSLKFASNFKRVLVSK